jgi:hypothetical protein
MKAALPGWLEHDQNPDCGPSVQQELLRMSASTIGRLLAEARAELRRKQNTGTRPGVRRFLTKVPIRDLGVTPTEPGHCEADCVAHCGGSLAGEFAWTVTLTDIATGWTECETIFGKNGHNVRKALERMEKRLPFRLIAIYVDNGCEFLNEEVIDTFANEHKPHKIAVFRGRPYRKNDQAYVEQKNYTHVRQLMGYGRIDWRKSVGMMNAIYRREWRQLQNFFMPQQKLIEKVRIGSAVKRRMDEPKTPFDRLLPFLDAGSRSRLMAERAQINPFKARNNQRVQVRKMLLYYKNEIQKNEWGKMAI